MGLFSKPEVVVLRESTAMKDYLAKIEALYQDAPAAVKPALEKEIAITKAGIVGEENILYELKNSGMDMVVLHDIVMENGEQSAQIDFFVITEKLYFILECKNLIGDIEINRNGDFIRSFRVGGRTIKEGIYSPITQNQRHLTVLKSRLLENNKRIVKAGVNLFFDNWYKSLVVLANPKTVLNDRYAGKEIREQVIRADRLTVTIKKMLSDSKEAKISKKGMLQFGERMLEVNVEKDTFAEKYQKLLAMTEEAKNAEPNQPTEITRQADTTVCPRCGGKLILRIAKSGGYEGNRFYGCSNYPRCRFIRNL